jgi:hypothetical protein
MNRPSPACTGTQGGFPPCPHDPWRPLLGLSANGQGFVRAELLESFSATGLTHLDHFFAVTGEPLTKPGLGNRYRARLQLGSKDSPATVYLKRFGIDRWRDSWRRRWEHRSRMTPGELEYRIATALLQAGIPVPAPLAWGWRGHPHQRQSFVILQAVPGQPAEVWATRLSADGPAESWHHKRRMVMALADLARRFHALGFRHRDFYLNHVFVSGSARTMELSLIDLQRVFRPRWRSQRWQVKDLAQLNFSATREAFSQTLRLRFFCHYLGVQSLKPEHKRLLHRILRKTRSMARRLRTRH